MFVSLRKSKPFGLLIFKLDFMNLFFRFTAVFLFFFAAFAALQFVVPFDTHSQAAADESDSVITFQKREEAYRANNLGVALLEQFNYQEAAEEFRRALEINPQLAIARTNLAIALFNAQEIEAALQEAQKAAEIAPKNLQPVYLLGLIAKNQNRTEEAVAFFKRVLEIDPLDVGANVNLGQIYMQQRQYAEAVTRFRIALNAEPYNSTALYNLATALLRSGEREEGQKLITQFQELRQSGAATSIGQNYLEQGRYAEAIVSTGAEVDLVDKTSSEVVFQNVNIGLPVSRSSDRNLKNVAKNPFTYMPQRGAALFDFDNDGDLDLVQIKSTAPMMQLFRNDNGKFVDATRASGDLNKPSDAVGLGVVAGDYDNDGLTDLLFFGLRQVLINISDGFFNHVRKTFGNFLTLKPAPVFSPDMNC